MIRTRGGVDPDRVVNALGEVVIVLTVLNGIAWLVKAPWLHSLNVFSAGFVLCMLGMYIAAYLYGYRRVT